MGMSVSISRHPAFVFDTSCEDSEHQMVGGQLIEVPVAWDIYRCVRCGHFTSAKRGESVNMESMSLHFYGCNLVVEDERVQRIIEAMAQEKAGHQDLLARVADMAAEVVRCSMIDDYDRIDDLRAVLNEAGYATN